MNNTGGTLKAMILATMTASSGCAQLGSLTSGAAPDGGHYGEAQEQISRVDQHSSFPAVRRTSYEQVNLIEMIDPLGEARRKYHGRWSEKSYGANYDLVLSWFRESPDSDEKKMHHRNSVQDKILGVSESRCNVFKTYLRRQQSDTNFWLGAATTVAGVLGAVLNGANASRNLAGAAGIFSGVQAEYNQSYYSNLAAHVIVQGIDLNRNRLLTDLFKQRPGLSINAYSMEAAIKDAIRIDGTCSTVAGLIEAQEAIKEVQNPGLSVAGQAILRVRALDELNKTDIKTLQTEGRLEPLQKLLAPAISPLAVSAAKNSSTSGEGGAAQAREAPLRIARLITQEAEKLGQTFDFIKGSLNDKKRGAVKGAEVSSKFQSSATSMILDPLLGDASGKGVLTACLSKLADSTEGLARAKAKLHPAAIDTNAGISAQLGVDTAQAAQRAAISRVENIVSAASDSVLKGHAIALRKFEKAADLTANGINFKVDDVAVSAKIAVDPLKCPES